MYTFGIDLGGTNIKIGLVNERGVICARRALKTKDYSGRDKIITAIVANVKSIIKDKKLKKTNLGGIGFALAGPLDIKRGIVYYFPNIKGWKNTPLKKIIQQKIGLPVAIDNDANLFAWAEHKFGAGRGVNNLVLLTLGTGIGGGLVLEGKLYRGFSFTAAEVGHIPVNMKGPRCNCGGWACLERYVGSKYIEAKAKNIFKRKISLEELSLLAKRGNKKAIKIWQDVGNYFGVALSGVINLLNPEAIVLSGGVAKAGGVLFSSIKNTIKKRAMPPSRDKVRILKARLGSDAGIIGAALLIKEGK